MPKSRKRKISRPTPPPGPPVWLEDDGVHALLPGENPSPEELETLSRRYQEEIRGSPLWDKMLKEYGPQEAERILLKCRVEVRP